MDGRTGATCPEHDVTEAVPRLHGEVRLLPFRALRYNPHYVAQLSAILGPPDDFRSHRQARELGRMHPYHSIWLELPDEDEEHFREAQQRFMRWRAENILVEDQHPGFYLYAHHYRRLGSAYRRLGIFGIIPVQDETSRPTLLPHEGVMPSVVARRLALRQALNADVSAIYVVAQAEGRLRSTLEDLSTKAEPLLDIHDTKGERHQLWAITDSVAIRLLTQVLANSPLVIADGHHRYAAARADWHARRSSGDQYADAAGLVLVHLVDAADPGIQLRPIHRLVRGLTAERVQAVLAACRQYCDVFELSPLYPLTAERLQHTLAAAQSVHGVIFVLASAATQHVYALYQSTAVAVPNELEVERCEHFVMEPLRRVLGLPPEAVGYEPELEGVVRHLVSDPTAAAVLLRPPQLADVLARAQLGRLLPPKSTSFYPKVPLGLLFRAFDVD
ncbi:MAG: DUF1015 domain-containing protein [Thermorudis peleae]|nr:DUF1015 domain-containing protein [Thermorudis peleae]